MLLFDDKFEDLYPEEIEDWKKQQAWKQLDELFAAKGFFLVTDWDDVKQIGEYQKMHMKYICTCGRLSQTTLRNLKKITGCWQCQKVNHDITDEERTIKRAFPEYKEWRTSVYERDHYSCQICGRKHGNLVAHHLDGYSWCRARRTDVSNGVTLCKDCHTKFHSIYSTHNNTKEQFAEFQKNFDENCVKTPL